MSYENGSEVARSGRERLPEKTWLVRFHPTAVADSEAEGRNFTGPRTFDFLGFTHSWGRSLKGVWVVKRKTAKGRLKRALQSLSDWCRQNLHQPIAVQHQALKQKLQGHYAYSGITGNFPSLQEFLAEASHVPMGVLAVLSGWARWLEIRLPPEDRTVPGWIWPVCFALIGVGLLNYREL